MGFSQLGQSMRMGAACPCGAVHLSRPPALPCPAPRLLQPLWVKYVYSLCE